MVSNARQLRFAEEDLQVAQNFLRHLKAFVGLTQTQSPLAASQAFALKGKEDAWQKEWGWLNENVVAFQAASVSLGIALQEIGVAAHGFHQSVPFQHYMRYMLHGEDTLDRYSGIDPMTVLQQVETSVAVMEAKVRKMRLVTRSLEARVADAIGIPSRIIASVLVSAGFDLHRVEKPSGIIGGIVSAVVAAVVAGLILPPLVGLLPW